MRTLMCKAGLILGICFGGSCQAHPSSIVPTITSTSEEQSLKENQEQKDKPSNVDQLQSLPTNEEPSAPLNHENPDILSLNGSQSTSVGSPTNGHLKNSVPLPLQGRGFRFNPKKRREARYGTVELIQALVQAAQVVVQELPDSELTINDISFAEGGVLSGHASHQNGRDVDVLFYLVDASGVPMASVAAPIDPNGEGTDYRDLADPADDIPVRLDIPRTWRFVQALLELPDAHVQNIFVVEHIRTLLIKHAKKVSASAAVIQRFGDLTCQPGFPHDDHLHIRFFCSAEDIALGCQDLTPIYPWHKTLLKQAGVKPVLARGRPQRKVKLTSVQEAREKAGAMDQKVIDFLDWRESWVRKPHPGRPYCP